MIFTCVIIKFQNLKPNQLNFLIGEMKHDQKISPKGFQILDFLNFVKSYNFSINYFSSLS